MAKKENTWLWIVGIVIVGIFLGPKLGLFSIYGTDFGSPLLSNYIVKAGFGQFNDVGSDEFDIKLMNELGTSFYAVGIFETPMVVDRAIKSSDLIRVNNDYSEEFGYTGDLISQKLIDTVDKGTDYGYTFDDYKIIVTEFEDSVDIFCEHGIEFKENCMYSLDSQGIQHEYCNNNSREINTVTEVCDKMPTNLFSITTNKIQLNALSDILLYGDDGQIMDDKLKLSVIKLEITKKGNDIAVGIGSTGITQANSIDTQQSFIDYESQIDHSQSINLNEDWDPDNEGITAISNKYTTLTNNDVVIDVASGTTFTDVKVCCKTTKFLSETTDVDYNNVMATRCMMPIGFDNGLVIKEVVDDLNCNKPLCGQLFDFD